MQYPPGSRNPKPPKTNQRTKGSSRKAALLADFKSRIIFKFKQRKKKEQKEARERAEREAELAGMPTPAEETADFWGVDLTDTADHEWVLSRAGTEAIQSFRSLR